MAGGGARMSVLTRGRLGLPVSHHVHTELARLTDPDVQAATVYHQQWRAPTTILGFLVLALDPEMAAVLGRLRLAARGNDVSRWTLVRNLPAAERQEAAVLAALHAECADETTLREETFASVSTSAGTSTTVTARSSAAAPNAADSGNVCRETELTGDAASDAVTRAFDRLRERGR